MIQDSDKIAMISNGKKISYHTLLQKIYVVSDILNDIKEDDRIMIFSEPRVGYVYALFSIWMKKAIYSSWFHNLDADISKWAFNGIKPDAIFVSEARYPLLKETLEGMEINPKIILINELEKIPVTNNTPLADLQLDTSRAAFIVHTAGITGEHKTVELSLSNVMAVINKLNKTNFYSADDKVLTYLPCYNNWILIATIITPLFIGCTCVFAPDNIESIIKTISDYKVSIIVAVRRVYTDLLNFLMTEKLFNINTMKYKIVSKINNKTNSKIAYRRVHKLLGNNIKYFLTVGANVEEEIYKPMLALGFEVFEGYGMAETSSLITYPASKRTHPQYVGKMLEGIEYKIINNELVLKGENIANKYYNRDALNKSIFNNGWFFTNDVIEIVDDENDKNNGMIRFIGRVGDEIVLKTGRVVILAELDKRIGEMTNYVRECGVFYDEGSFKVIIVPSQNMIDIYGIEDNYLIIHSILRWKVIEHYNHTVPAYKKISHVIITEENLPRSTSGKIKRYLLKELEEINFIKNI